MAFGPIGSIACRRSWLIDSNGLKLYQARPRKVISLVEAATGLEFNSVRSRNGRWKSLSLVTLFSAPYYVFRKK